LLGWLLPLIPVGGNPYTEAYLGSGAVLLNRAPAKTEAVNDLDGNIVNFFRVLQKRDSYEELKYRLRYTPYSYAEFRRAHEILAQGVNAHPVDRAWAFFVIQNQGFSGVPYTRSWAFSMIKNHGARFRTNVASLDLFVERLRSVHIEQGDALEFLPRWDTPNAVHYLDPPYVRDMRVDPNLYRYEMPDDHHVQLVSLILSLKGAVVLSGYPNRIYCALEEAGWARYDKERPLWMSNVNPDRGYRVERKRFYRTESVWLNPKAQALLRTRESA